MLNVLGDNNTKVGELSGDCILHGEPELLIFLTLSFSDGFHCLAYHVLHLIPGSSCKLCIVQRRRSWIGGVDDDDIRFSLVSRSSLIWSFRLLGHKFYNIAFNFINYGYLWCLKSFVHDNIVGKINDDPTQNGVIHNFSRCLTLDEGNHSFHISSNNFFF